MQTINKIINRTTNRTTNKLWIKLLMHDAKYILTVLIDIKVSVST